MGGSSNAFVHVALVAMLRGYCFSRFPPVFRETCDRPKGCAVIA